MPNGQPLREFRDRFHHLHAKDAKILRNQLNDVGVLATPLEYHQPRIPGKGEIDWAQYIGALKSIGYRGPLCIEVEDETFGKTLPGRKRAISEAYRTLAPLTC